MRSGWYRGRDGDMRLWLDGEDIETVMEDELRKARLFPTERNPAVNLEAFIERHIGAHLDQHAQLEPMTLGQTEFLIDRPPRVLINADLTGAAMDDDESTAGLRGRWRATLAHEASHVVMHRFLFELDNNDDLFGGSVTRTPQRLMRCLKASVLFRDGAADWREFQANRGMAALLMPRPVFLQITTAAITRLALSPQDLTPADVSVRRLAAEIASVMQVSKQAARIRLETLGILTAPGQRRLIGMA